MGRPIYFRNVLLRALVVRHRRLLACDTRIKLCGGAELTQMWTSVTREILLYIGDNPILQWRQFQYHHLREVLPCGCTHKKLVQCGQCVTELPISPITVAPSAGFTHEIGLLSFPMTLAAYRFALVRV